jgi:GNAT superfamily N-acetyltransferase
MHPISERVDGDRHPELVEGQPHPQVSKNAIMNEHVRHFETQNGPYQISTDPARIEIDAVERFLRASYWAANRSRAKIERSIQTSIVFGIYDGPQQVGFARVVSDQVDFAWLCDVYLDESIRGRNLGKWLMQTILAHPDLQGLRRWMLATNDAHGLYEQFGFTALTNPMLWMERPSAP